MQTIYNLLHPMEPINKGLIEVFNMYDYSHYLIALDGKVIECIEDNDYESSLLENKFLKKVLKKSGVKAKDLLFVYYEFELFARKIIDYDMNNYGYKEMYTLVNKNIANIKELQAKILYHGVIM